MTWRFHFPLRNYDFNLFELFINLLMLLLFSRSAYMIFIYIVDIFKTIILVMFLADAHSYFYFIFTLFCTECLSAPPSRFLTRMYSA